MVKDAMAGEGILMTTDWRRFGVQIVVHLALAGAFSGLVIWLLALQIWPAAAIWSVPTLGVMTRVVVLVRIRRMGWYAADESDRPSVAAVNRETSNVFLVQLIGWIAVAAYSAATGTWLALGVAILLAFISLCLLRLLRKSQGSTSLPGGR